MMRSPKHQAEMLPQVFLRTFPRPISFQYCGHTVEPEVYNFAARPADRSTSNDHGSRRVTRFNQLNLSLNNLAIVGVHFDDALLTSQVMEKAAVGQSGRYNHEHYRRELPLVQRKLMSNWSVRPAFFPTPNQSKDAA